MTCTISIGESVRARLPGSASFLRGEVEDITEDGMVVVRGRRFPMDQIVSQDAIDAAVAEQKREQARLATAQRIVDCAHEEALELIETWEEALDEKWDREHPDEAVQRIAARKAAKAAFIHHLIADTTQSRNQLFGYIQTYGAIRVECTDETFPAFCEYYQNLTGIIPIDNGDTCRVFLELKHHRGNEYRVTFPIPDFPLPDLGVDYQSAFSGGASRFTLNSKELFEFFVQQGMRL